MFFTIARFAEQLEIGRITRSAFGNWLNVVNFQLVAAFLAIAAFAGMQGKEFSDIGNCAFSAVLLFASLTPDVPSAHPFLIPLFVRRNPCGEILSGLFFVGFPISFLVLAVFARIFLSPSLGFDSRDLPVFWIISLASMQLLRNHLVALTARTIDGPAKADVPMFARSAGKKTRQAKRFGFFARDDFHAFSYLNGAYSANFSV